MQFSDIRSRAQFLSMAALGTDERAPGPDWPTLVNRAYADFSWDTEFNEEMVTFTTVTNQALYVLPTPYFKAVKELAYQNASNGAYVRLTESSETQEHLMDPLWFTRPMGVSSRYITPGPNQIRLVDPPSNTGDTVTVYGTRQAPPLVNDTDLPAFPDTWHEALALKAAYYYTQALAASPADAARVQAYLNRYQELIGDCKLYLSGQRYSPVLRRQVRRGYRGRVTNFGFGNY